MNKNTADVIRKFANPKYFIESFFWIINKDREKVPFLFNPAQAKYYANRTQNDLILKARKEGFSSLIEALWLHACLFVPNTRAVVLSHELESTKRHFDRIRFFLETMGTKDLRFTVDLDEDSQRQIKFPHTNSSYWIGTAGARSFGRGDDITHLHLSEVAHYENQDVLTSALEACVPNSYKVMETTAKGVGEAFYKLWKEAKDPQSNSPWKPHFFAWFEDPTNVLKLPEGVTFRMTEQEKRMQAQYKLTPEQVYWYRMKRAAMADKDLMPQENPANDLEAFLSSGRHAFNLEKVQEKKNRATPPLRVCDIEDNGQEVYLRDTDEGRLRIWKMPRIGSKYLISGDVGEGVPEGDFSVAHILDRSNWEVIAVWRGRENPGQFGRILTSLGYFFNNAVLAPELNNHGWATVEAIKEQRYPHLLNTKELWRDETPRDGFPTNERTRQQILTAIRNANDDDTVFIPDLVTLEEMETFVQNEKTNKFEAQKGCHDDCVMSLAIAVYCIKFLTVDSSYGPHVKKIHGSPILTTSIVPHREHAGGYRRKTGY